MNTAGHLHHPASALPPARFIQRWAILATLAAALVLAAIMGLKLGALPEFPGKIVVGVSIAVFFGAALAAIKPPEGPGPAACRAAPPPDDSAPVAANNDNRRPSEGELVQTWRRTLLAELGVPEDVALVLAEERSFSPHELKRLLVDGCPLGTALRILWPA
jgi:hypothetical protein